MEGNVHIDPRLNQLETWLASGWQIEEPILQRNAYHGPHGRTCSYEVVVHHAGERRVCGLRDAPDVQDFLLRRQLAVLDVS
ncbi:MAG: hypothetical protein M3R24_35415 [Chloroflexota bacterium]|nr:hypothetical protein [Chloroflexota bacterium]